MPTAVGAPQTVHFTGFFNWSAQMARFASSRISGGTTGRSWASVSFHVSPALISLWQKSRHGNNTLFDTLPGQAASGI